MCVFGRILPQALSFGRFVYLVVNRVFVFFYSISYFQKVINKNIEIIKQRVLEARDYVDRVPDHHLLFVKRASISDEI